MGHLFEGSRDPSDLRCGGWLRPFNPLEKNSLLRISVLVGVKDVAALLENPAGHTRHQARSVWSMKESND
jgi:hypothetical protein